MRGRELSAHGYALAVLLLSDADRLPLSVRAAWLGALRPLEPHPALVREAALRAHLSGHARAGRLTGKGELAALNVLRGVGNPPRSIEEVNGEP